MPCTIQIYDPALCCPTGVCGPSVDPGLVAFAADVEWLVKNGVSVVRYNLAQQPQAFVENHAVKRALESDGAEGLPLTIVDGEVRCSARYPSREQLAEWAGVDMTQACEAREVAIVPEKSPRCC